VVTDASGAIKAESDYYPWGGELQFVANDSNHYKFTGKERDGESGLDYFGARYYSNGLGRWVSADWSAAPVPVPYADFADPQSLNLYGYVRSVPTTRFDVDGHCQQDQSCLAQQSVNNFATKPKDFGAALKGAGKHLLNTLANAMNLLGGKIGGGNFSLNGPDEHVGANAVNQLMAAAPILGELKPATIVAEVGAGTKTPSVIEQLQGAANEAVQNVGPGRGPAYGTAVHSEFADLVDGLGSSKLATEVSYKGGVQVPYGTPGSIRVDVVEGPLNAPTAVYDLKTGSATLSPARVEQIQSHLPGGSNVPVQEIRPQ
jgi:RHS repeat-associated protein